MSDYGIHYEPHSELKGFSNRGLQTIGEKEWASSGILFPGYCNTYVFIYIEEICKYHADNHKLVGIDLFRKAVNHIDETFSRMDPGYTESFALEYNRQLQITGLLIYDQLIESKPVYTRETRLQRSGREFETKSAEERSQMTHFDPERKVRDLINKT